MEKRGQVSIEFMAIIGFVTFVSLTMLVISQYYQREVATQVETNQVDHLARKLVESAESVYYLGAPSKTTITANMPDHVDSITITDNEIIFKLKVAGGTTDISYTSDVKLAGPGSIPPSSISTSPGLKKINVTATCPVAGCEVLIQG